MPPSLAPCWCWDAALDCDCKQCSACGLCTLSCMEQRHSLRNSQSSLWQGHWKGVGLRCQQVLQQADVLFNGRQRGLSSRVIRADTSRPGRGSRQRHQGKGGHSHRPGTLLAASFTAWLCDCRAIVPVGPRERSQSVFVQLTVFIWLAQHLALVMEYAACGSLTSYVAEQWQAAQHSGLFLSEDEARYFFRVRC